MRKLRNIGYLRFGPKIRQGFAGGITSLTLLSPSPLSGSRGQEMRVRGKGLSFYIGGSLPPPAGRAGCLRPLHRAAGACRPAGGQQTPARGLRTKNYVYLHVGPCRPPTGR